MLLVGLPLRQALTFILGADIAPWALGSWTQTKLGLSPEDGERCHRGQSPGQLTWPSVNINWGLGMQDRRATPCPLPSARLAPRRCSVFLEGMSDL